MVKRRHSSLDKLVKIATVLGFNEREKRYFLFLFLKETTRDNELKNYFETTLGVMRAQESARKTCLPEAQEQRPAAMKDSLSMVIHAMAGLPDFCEEAAWISARLIESAPLAEIAATTRELLKGGEIIRTKRGFAAVEKPHTPDPTQKELFAMYRIGLDQAQAAVSDISRHRGAQFYMGTMATDRAGLHAMVDELGRFATKLSEISGNTRVPDRVATVSLNLFDVTK